MKLIVENAPEHESWLHRAFEVVTRELGIYDSDWTVNVRLQPGYNSAGTHGYDRKKPKTSHITICESNVKRGGVKSGPRMEDAPMFSMLEAFCHEMVHVKQTIKDGLDSNIRQNGKLGSNFKGRFYGRRELQLKSMFEELYPHQESPWEKEAYMKMFDLADKVEGRKTHHFEWLRRGDVPPNDQGPHSTPGDKISELFRIKTKSTEVDKIINGILGELF